MLLQWRLIYFYVFRSYLEQVGSLEISILMLVNLKPVCVVILKASHTTERRVMAGL